MPAHKNNKCHYKYIDKIYGKKVFPFKGQKLVNPQTRESPFEPHHQKDNKKCFTNKPDKRRNEIHDVIESVPVPTWNGIHPPRKTVAAIDATMNIFIYSARKKNANLIPEYSV